MKLVGLQIFKPIHGIHELVLGRTYLFGKSVHFKNSLPKMAWHLMQVESNRYDPNILILKDKDGYGFDLSCIRNFSYVYEIPDLKS